MVGRLAFRALFQISSLIRLRAASYAQDPLRESRARGQSFKGIESGSPALLARQPVCRRKPFECGEICHVGVST